MAAVEAIVRVRRGTAATATANNPVLKLGEVGYETDTGRFKVGDGSTAWNSLAYATDPASLANRLIGGLTPAADRLPYFTGSGAAALATFTSFGRSLVDDADATAARATLGLGNVNNTSDTAKPVSTAQQTALDAKADATTGTWTPSFGGDGADPTITYANQNGQWSRLGNIVHLLGELEIASKSGGSGNLQIKGFPVAATSGRYLGAMTVGYGGGFITTLPTGGYVPASSSFAYVCGDVSGSRTNISTGTLQAGSLLIFHITYRAA